MMAALERRGAVSSLSLTVAIAHMVAAARASSFASASARRSLLEA
jgi:hypothetical protein